MKEPSGILGQASEADEDVAHEAYVLIDILWHAVGWTRDVGFVSGRLPALQATLLAGTIDADLDLPNGVKVLVQFGAVEVADLPSQAFGIVKYSVDDQFAALGRGVVFEEAVECQRRVEFKRCRRCWTAPRNVRAVKHRVFPVNGRDGLFTTQYEARYFGLVADLLRDDLVETRTGPNLPTGR